MKKILLTLKSYQLFITALFLFKSTSVAQVIPSHFMTEGAVHEYEDGTDRLQRLADDFMFEGHRQWGKMSRKRFLIKHNYSEKKKNRIFAKEELMEKKHPKHKYVVIFSPPFAPSYGFAVEKDEIVYLERLKSNRKSNKYRIYSNKLPLSKETCRNLCDLMDAIVVSSEIELNMYNTFDATTLRIIVGCYPTHMVCTTTSTADKTKTAVINLFETICRAAKENKSDVIQSLNDEITRLYYVYVSLNTADNSL